MKTRIFNLLILDESGSMSSIEKHAVDGVHHIALLKMMAQSITS